VQRAKRFPDEGRWRAEVYDGLGFVGSRSGVIETFRRISNRSRHVVNGVQGHELQAWYSASPEHDAWFQKRTVEDILKP